MLTDDVRARRLLCAKQAVPHLDQHLGLLTVDRCNRFCSGDPLNIVAELRATPHSERQGHLIDRDEEAAMERKKREGY